VQERKALGIESEENDDINLEGIEKEPKDYNSKRKNVDFNMEDELSSEIFNNSMKSSNVFNSSQFGTPNSNNKISKFGMLSEEEEIKVDRWEATRKLEITRSNLRKKKMREEIVEKKELEKIRRIKERQKSLYESNNTNIKFFFFFFFFFVFFFILLISEIIMMK
jgi:hypothetical protein